MTDAEWLLKFWEARVEAEIQYRAYERISQALAALAYLHRMQEFNREVERERPRTA